LVEQPRQVIEANLAPSTAPGVVASARIDLSNTPQYRPPFDVCDRREVVVTVSPHLIGGTAPQVLAIRGSVYYDDGVNDTFVFDQSESFIVKAGEDGIFTHTIRGDLDKDRILLIEVIYVTEVTPPPGSGVTLVPTVPPAADVVVSIYDSKEYPARHNKPIVYAQINV
jgi:hypothetical protein